MKIIFVCIGLLGMNVSWSAAADHTQYVHVAGQLAGQSTDAIFASLQKTFVDPLAQNQKVIRYSYVDQVNSDSYFIDVIVEPMTENDLPTLQAYISTTEQNGFGDIPVKFRQVKSIFEQAILEAGNYDATADDAFVQTFQISRGFSFSTLADWVQFTDGYTDALYAGNQVLINYLSGFIANPAQLSDVSNVLASSNMVGVEPQTYVILDDNSVIEPDIDQTPFLPLRIIRNCWSPDFDNGFCYKASGQSSSATQ
jgi:hypothetical protein